MLKTYRGDAGGTALSPQDRCGADFRRAPPLDRPGAKHNRTRHWPLATLPRPSTTFRPDRWVARLADLLSRHGTSRPADLSALARAVILRIAVGDTDGHVRNFGFLHRDQTISLAPAYDVAPTSLFVSGTQVGLWVDGQSYLPAITRGHLLREFAVWRLPGRPGAGLLEETMTRLAEAIPAAQRAVASVPDRVVDATAARIRRLRNSPL
jgi:HipA-like C-terminal domain